MKCHFDLLQYWHDKLCIDFETDKISVELFLVLDLYLTDLKESNIRELYFINLN